MGGTFDVVVVGGGHAGCEAAHATARLGHRTLLLTLRRDRIGWMSCNPAVGGMAKGHLVREVDALGGLMGAVTDATGIQFRRLNTRRGPAVRGTRAQVDRRRYALEMQRRLAALDRLEVREGLVESLLIETAGERPRVAGVRTEGGAEWLGRAVILTCGTFLNGVAHVGLERTVCGREDEPAALHLSDSLRSLGLELGRFKTGTTPRLDGESIDFGRLAVQHGDKPPPRFETRPGPGPFPRLPQRVCHLTATNSQTIEIIRESRHLSPLFRGRVTGTAPRYCPSIEDKVTRFADRTGHTVYLEPEGLDTTEVYPAGLSTSLPQEVQLALLRTIEGLEEVRIVRPGYAIEYDYVIPTQLGPGLEVSRVEGLWLAGQMNGTSGYEEAAAQGLVAGMDAARRLAGRPPLRIRRSEAYLGVLVDDLVTAGTGEPYRMFTSRAEHRLRLREDNADLRLAERAFEAGLRTPEELEAIARRAARVSSEVRRLETTPAVRVSRSRRPLTVADLLRRPELSYAETETHDPEPALRVGPDDAETVALEVKYSGYVARQDRRLAERSTWEELTIPEDLRLRTLPGLSAEVVEKLEAHRPRTLGQAGRISGITPAALDVLAVHLSRCGRAVDGFASDA